MAIEQGLYQIIAQSSTIQSAVGTDANGTTRAYWVLAPQGSVVPFLVLSRISTADTYAMSGSMRFRNSLFQIACYSSSYYSSRTIAETVRQFLENYTGTLPDTGSTVVNSVMTEKDWDAQYEEGAKGFIYAAYLQFRIWYRD